MGDSSGHARLLREAPEELVPAEYAAHLVDVASRFRVKPDALLKGTEISAAQLDNPEATLPRHAVFTLCRRALALTEEPGLGFYYGLSLKLSSHGAPGLLAMTSGTLLDAIGIVERFVRLRSMALSLRTYAEDGALVLEFQDSTPPDLEVFYTESFCVMLLNIGRALVGQPIPARCELKFSELAHFRRFAHLLPSGVRFGCATNRLLLPTHFLNAAVVTSDLVTARRIERDCQKALALLDQRASFLSKLRRHLRPEHGDFPSLEELAVRMHSSTRTIKRKLAEQGTNYRKLVDELRRDRASELLRGSDYSVEQIAAMLGYTDAASFHRSFRRWFGTTPRAH